MVDLQAALDARQQLETERLTAIEKTAETFMQCTAAHLAARLPELARLVGMPQQAPARALGESGMATLRKTVQDLQETMDTTTRAALNQPTVWPHLNRDSHYRRTDDARNARPLTVPARLTAELERAYPKDAAGVRGQFAWALADCLAPLCKALEDAGFRTTPESEEGDDVVAGDLVYAHVTWSEEALAAYAGYRAGLKDLREAALDVDELAEEIAGQDIVKLWADFV